MPKVEDIAREGDLFDYCLLWQYGQFNSGYGQVWYKGSPHRLHRAIWEEIYGPIPENMTIDHLCKNKLCYNHTHLDICTTQENTARISDPEYMAIAWDLSNRKGL
jgi:hypothetical protein